MGGAGLCGMGVFAACRDGLRRVLVVWLSRIILGG